MSNILIIGNGFELYHRLTIRYSDFLFLADNWTYFINKYNSSTASGDENKLINIKFDNGWLVKVFYR